MALAGTRVSLVVCFLLTPSILIAQESRAAAIEQMRADKAANLHPYEPGRLERTLLYIEREDPLRKIAPRNGFFVEYGYAGKPIGSGIGAGIGYRSDLFDRRARLVLETGATWRRYRLMRADFSLPTLAAGRVELGVEVSDRHNPQEDFYGLGPESRERDRVSFLFDRRDVQARAIAKLLGPVRLGARVGRLAAKLGRGRDSRFPSIEELFTDADAPGLNDHADYLYGDLFVDVDTRDQPGNPRAGGYYAVQWRRYDELDLDRADFRVIESDVQHFFPIFDKKRVFAVRGRVFSTAAGAGRVVPFYFQPTLGGSDSLRSVREFRFRDTHVLAVNVEYRWEAFSGLDMALFSDVGKVASRAEDLDFDDLEHAYGIGLRFNTYKAVFLRLDVSLAGGESPRYFLKFNKAF
jgi:hypothetical protein